MIELKNIFVKFKDQHQQTINAVDNVTLSVKKGEVYGIIGYSGAGKSTLVRVINLLQKPTSGSVYINGRDLINLSANELRVARTKIGMIFQHFNLMDSRTVQENVLYPLRNSSLTKQQKLQKVDSLLELVGLTAKRDVYPSQLSGGQKQRVAIARALANDPEILLCDEATSALDPKTTLSILKLLKSLNQSMGLTIVLITHEMQVVKEICHKVAVMEKGKVVEQGNIVDLFTQPKHALTQNFIRIATHVDQAYEAILAHPTLTKLADDERLFELKYNHSEQFTPFISDITTHFALKVTVAYSYIEILNNQPVGSLIVIIKGDRWQIEKALTYLHQQNITTNRLNLLQDANYYTI